MNTTVITVGEVDFGAGAQRRHVFVGCTHHVDDTGTLHIVRKGAGGNSGNVAALAKGEWAAVVRGHIANAITVPDGDQ